MKLRIVPFDSQRDMKMSGMVLTEDFALVGFIYSEYRLAHALMQSMVEAFNERPQHVKGCDGAACRFVATNPCECWCHDG